MSSKPSLGPSRWAIAPLSIAFLALSSCKGCRDEKPYTPFGVTTSLPEASSAPPASALVGAPAASASGAAVKKAAFAPAGAERWTLEGRELESPAGRVFEQGLVADFDADGQREIVAWTLPAAGANDAPPGELWLYPANGAARKILDFPAFLPTGTNCTEVSALSQSAPRTLTVDVRVACSTQLVGRAPTRALAVVDPFAARAPRFGVRAADPAPGERLRLDLTSGDEDDDGREDYRLSGSVALDAAPPEIVASFVFLDRAAGVSRDARQPVKGLLELVKKDSARALKAKTAEAARKHVELARRLLASLCAEGATPRVFDWSGAPLPCGALGEMADRLTATEITAALALADFAGALAALGRDGWYFGALRATTRDQLMKDIDKRVPARTASRSVLGVRPKARRAPSLSPLRFEIDGTLLIATDSGLYRFAPDSTREEPVAADSPITPWPLDAVTPSGEHWIGVSYSCDRSETQLLMSGATSEPQTVALLAPRPGVCGGARFDEGFLATPITLAPRVHALVGGSQVGEKGSAPPPPGSARSANGRYLAIPTPLGLYVDGPSPELWKIDGFGVGSKSGCVVDDGGGRAACVSAGRAEVYVRAAL